jgi:predicted XRE-type DNA-binding protein
MDPDPIPALKEQLAKAILTETQRLNQLYAARILGLDEPRMSNLEHGKLERFSLQKLIRLLARINRRVEMSILVVGPLPRLNFRIPRSPDGVSPR